MSPLDGFVSNEKQSTTVDHVANLLEQIGIREKHKFTARRLYICVHCRNEAPSDYFHAGGTYYCPQCQGRSVQIRHLSHSQQIRESIPARYRWASLVTASAEMYQRVGERNIIAARVALHDMLGGDRTWTTLQGPAGVGKTSLAAAFVDGIAVMLERSKGDTMTTNVLADTRFFTAPDLAKARREQRYGTEEHNIVRLAHQAPYAVIDEVGGEDSHSQVVSEILLSRYQHEKRTVITTALSYEQIVQRYGDGIARRLFDDGALVKMERGE